MTLGECVRLADAMRPNACGEQEKLRWVMEVEQGLRREFLPRYEGPQTGQGAVTSATRLVASGPYEGLYLYRLLAQMELAQQEWESYNAYNTLANQALSGFKKAWHRTHRRRREGERDVPGEPVG